MTDTELREQFARMNQRFDTMDQRFDTIDQRFDTIDQRFETIDQRFETIDQQFENVKTRIGNLNSLLEATKDSLENEVGEVRDTLKDLQRRLNRQAGLIQTGSRHTTRMIDWSERVDVALEELKARVQALEDKRRAQ